MDSISAETRSEIYEKLWTRMPRLNPGPMGNFRIDDFIVLIRQHPIIYNRLDKHNKQEYADTWDKLEVVLKTPKKFLMMKWKGLRDNFRVELKKEFYSPPDNRYVSKWVHYRKLAFLREQVLPTLDQKQDNDSHDDLHQILQFVQTTTTSEDLLPPADTTQPSEHSYANSGDLRSDPNFPAASVKEERSDEDSNSNSLSNVPRDTASTDGEYNFPHFQQPDDRKISNSLLPEITITPKIIPHQTELPPQQQAINLQRKRRRSQESTPPSPPKVHVKQVAAVDPGAVTAAALGVPQDDDYHFLMSIHPYLKQLPLPVKLKVRLQMQQVLFNELMKQPIADEED